jgi:hypothetical protein
MSPQPSGLRFSHATWLRFFARHAAALLCMASGLRLLCTPEACEKISQFTM